VKKVCFVNILLFVMMIAFASCSSAPKKQKTDSVPPKISVSEAPVQAEEDPVAELPVEEQPPLVEPVPEIPETVADNAAEEEPRAKPVEPEPPAVAVVPEPEPPRAAEPPPVSSAPQPEPPRVTPPPPAAARPPATPPPSPVVPPAGPPAAEEKPPAEEPPAIAREPLPRDGPELPSPTPGISGWQDTASSMVFSRVVRATVGQLVEVPFRGTGWVYLGEAGAQRGIIYDSRRLEPDGQSFIFRTERAGDYALKFYRQDFIRDFIINDYVQVIVGAPAETAGTGWFGPSIDWGRVVAEPRWPSALGESQALRADGRPAQSDAPAAGPAAGSTANTPPSAAPVRPSTSPSAETPIPSATPPAASQVTPATPAATRPTTPQITSPTTPSAATPTAPPAATATPPAVPDASKNTASELPAYVDPAEYLEKAKEEFAAGRVASAISFLDRFCEQYPSGTDETWWLYGQFYEANSPSRNILASLNSYRRLVQEYPQSSRFDDARKRIAYLQRYYININ